MSAANSTDNKDSKVQVPHDMDETFINNLIKAIQYSAETLPMPLYYLHIGKTSFKLFGSAITYEEIKECTSFARQLGYDPIKDLKVGFFRNGVETILIPDDFCKLYSRTVTVKKPPVASTKPRIMISGHFVGVPGIPDGYEGTVTCSDGMIESYKPGANVGNTTK